jgi:Lysozyme like domain
MATLSPSQLNKLADQAGWHSVGERNVAVAIARAESGGNPDARGGPNSNGTYDWGLWQINDVHHPTDAQKHDPAANAALAYRIYLDAGKKFTPWSTYNSGSYKKYVTTPNSAIDVTNSPIGVGNIPNPVSGVEGAIANATHSLATTALNIGLDLIATIVAIVLLVIGMLILVRGTPIAKTVKSGVVAAAL